MSEAKLDHVAFGVPDVVPAARLLAGELGARQRDSGPGAGFLFWQWELGGGGAVEIIVPDGPPGGFLHRFLAARGAGPHHLTFKVADVRAELERARALGYEPVGFDDRFPSWIEAFLHPRQAQGIVVQLAESHPESDPAGGVERPAFPAVARAAQTARLLGLRLSVRSEERARRQWETLLGGSVKASADGLTVRWPGSPLRLALRIDATAEEGPLALELAADRELALPAGPHPVLGLPLLQLEDDAT